MKHRKQGPGHATAQGRRRRYLCLALTLYTPLLTAVVLIVTYTHPIDFSLSEYLLLIWPLSAMGVLLGAMFAALEFYGLLYLIFPLLGLLSLLPLAGWFMGNAGKEAGPRLIRGCMIAQLLFAVAGSIILLPASFMAIVMDAPWAILPVLLLVAVPIATLLAVNAWWETL